MDSIVNLPGENPGGRSRYYLNDAESAKKLKAGAKIQPLQVEAVTYQGGQAYNIYLSTGAYITVMLTLLKDWQACVGQIIDPEFTDGLETKVLSVRPKYDQGGLLEGYTVKLQALTIQLYAGVIPPRYKKYGMDFFLKYGQNREKHEHFQRPLK